MLICQGNSHCQHRNHLSGPVGCSEQGAAEHIPGEQQQLIFQCFCAERHLQMLLLGEKNIDQ